MQDMKNNIKKVGECSLKSKLLLITSLITIVAISIMSLIFYNRMYHQTTSLLQQQALFIAKSAALFIDADEFERISLSLDSNDYYYKEGTSLLKKLNDDIGKGMLYAIVNQDPDYYTYVIDGSDTVDIGYKQKKVEFAEEADKAFTTGKSYYSKPYRVSGFKNQFISAFVPLVNSKDEVVGIIEYDYEAPKLIEAIRAINVHSIEVVVILIVLMLAINYFILIRLTSPLEQLVKSIGIIATGDLTIELVHNDNNEIGRINGAINETVSKIREILEKIKESSKKVTMASKSIVISSKDATEVYEELAVSTSKMLDTTRYQLAESRAIETQLRELEEEMKMVYDQIYLNEQEFSQICEFTHGGFKVIEEAENQIKNMENRLTAANQSMENLSHYMNSMHEMITTILKISEQATLLGLNLETEKYHKYDKDSKWISDSVKQLMNQSQTAIIELEQIINFVYSQIGFVVDEMRESTKLLSSGLEATSKSKGLLIGMTSENEKLGQKMSDLNVRIQETRDKISHIKQSVKDIEEVSTFIDTSTMNLLAITQEQVATSEEFKAMAELLREQAKVLHDSISRFKV